MNILSTIRSRSINLKPVRQLSPLTRSNTADFGSLSWTFDQNNHYLSRKLVRMVYNKWMLRAMAISLGLFIFVFADPVIACSYYVIISVTLWIPFFMLVVLSFNLDALGFLIKSSEFWIKIIYAGLHAILEAILYHQVGKSTTYKDVPEYIGYTTQVCRVFNNILFLAIVGGMDAVPKMTYKWKVGILGLVSILFTFVAVLYQLIEPAKHDYVVEVQTTGSVISFHSLLVNVCGMIAMFLWKQMLDVWYNRGRCISIIYRPYLFWKSAEEDKEVMAQIPEMTTVVVQSADILESS